MKNLNKLLFFFLIFISGISIAQSDKYLIKYSDLTFKDDAEKSAFSEFDKSKDNAGVFDLLFCSYDKSKSGNKSAAIQKINNCVDYLKGEISDKPDVKKVKIVYDYVHKHFLNIYKLKNSFIDIFENGEYNCLSASALYAVIFSKLSIPYQIRETPDHVYLVAYPNSSKVLVETTAPVKGYYQFKDSYVTTFVNNLYQSKIISKEEYENTPANDLFNKHYFTSEGVSLLELSGMQYSNFAIYHLEESDYKNANQEIIKAYYLFPGEKHKYLLKTSLAAMLDNIGYDDLKNVDNLAILCRFNNLKEKEISNEVISNEFIKIIQAQLIKNSDYVNFEKSYLRISGELNDTTLRKEIGFDYHYELARLGYSNSKSQEYELEHLSAAYSFNPLNANLRTIILSFFETTLRKYNDSRSIMDLAEKFSAKFDFLKESDSFLSIRANCLLDMAYQNYYLSNSSKGDAYIKEFEDIIRKNANISPGVTFVEKAYSQAAGEYYKKGNLSKAKQLLKSGLIYAPNSFGLQQRLNQIK
jgi:hypothetical protein